MSKVKGYGHLKTIGKCPRVYNHKSLEDYKVLDTLLGVKTAFLGSG